MIYQNEYMKLIYRILFLGCVVLTILSGCQIVTERGESPETKDVRKDERYSLAEDRAQFDELRKSVPEDVRVRNDEKSLYMQWMADYTMDPSAVRSKFSSLVSRKREAFNKDMNKIRDEYNKDERKKKEEFSKKSAEERQDIKDQNVSREKRTELYNEHDAKRKDFYAQLREERDSFETDYRQKRKDFEEYIKEKSDIFYAELKNYTVKFNELKKQQKN